ncbi:nuclear pore complex protein Nup85 isoform X1 [Periplaneta americana]|uniref:nuclear pore complex protein Nup85 isoform X1 n=1 Tax=Periplaneta americana TaxID=6978 RepID=UPI0037E798C4
MKMEEENIYAIPDEVCQRAGLRVTWIPGNRLGAHAYQHVTAHTQDRASEYAPCEAKVHQLRFDVMLFDPITRKLINESNGTFLAGQKLAEKAGGNDIRPDLLKLSRQYRSIVRACLENLQTEASKNDSSRKEVCLKLVAIFYNVEFLWHLCEILYVDVVPGDVVLPQLMEWIKFHFFRYERQAQAILNAEYGPTAFENGAENEPEYWNTVIGLVLQGRMDGARALLRLHSSFVSEPFKLVDQIMRTMPMYSVYGGLSLKDFNMRWKGWKNEIISKLEYGAFSSRKELELLMKLMAGNPEAFLEVKDQCESWYQFMASWLLYTEPTVKSFDLSYHAHQCIAKFGGISSLKESDLILLALMESDQLQVVNLIEETSENGWFAAHLTHLLYLCGCLKITDNQQTDVTAKLVEHLLLDYGTLLMCHHSLWQVGVSYLDCCSVEGRACMEALLPTLPLESEKRALKIIQVARERDLHHIVASICKVMGMRAYQQHRLGNALTWALRSQDAGFTTYLATKFLELYTQEGKFHSMDLLDNLGSCMLVSDRLTFLGKYCEFHQLYNAGEFRDAAVLLVSLLASRLAPKNFWMTLLTDALPLLESNDIVLTSEDTYELLNCMEELLAEGQISEPAGTQGGDKIISTQDLSIDTNNIVEEKVKLIRLALARNLARSLNHEGCLLD